jgi:competence protein ComEA
MIHLTPQERKVLLFVSFLVALGLFLSFYKKTVGVNTCFIDLYTNKAKPASLDVNRAPLEELIALPGIGPKTAQAILEYRAAHNGFKNLDELKNIKGISDNKLMRLEKYLKVSETQK